VLEVAGHGGGGLDVQDAGQAVAGPDRPRQAPRARTATEKQFLDLGSDLAGLGLDSRGPEAAQLRMGATGGRA
jgi:hypothetical protein